MDTHAHVHDAAFDSDRAAVVERARALGVSDVLTVGCDLADSRNAVACARTLGLRASVGIHPHEAKDAPANIEAAFAPLLDDPHVCAIGETGLDYFYDHSPRDAQMRCLRDQIVLAKKRSLPLIFHHRDAFDDFIAVLRDEFERPMRGVVHCFTGNAREARTYVEEFGLRLGIGGVLTFKSAQSVRDAVAAVGLNHCVLETDCPYLAPVPHRGARNEPAFLVDTAGALAALFDVSLAEVEAVTDANARALFEASPA